MRYSIRKSERINSLVLELCRAVYKTIACFP